MKINYKKQKSGYATVLTVVMVGLISLTIFNMIFSTSMLSQEVVKESTVRQDSQTREDAFLDALIAIVAERAQKTMSETVDFTSLTWDQIFQDAMVSANLDGANSMLDQADPTTGAITNIVTAMQVTGRNGDPADFASPQNNLSQFVQPVAAGQWVNPGTNQVITGNYPAALNYGGTGADGLYPIISDLKEWGALAAGAVTLPVANYPNNNLMAASAGLFKATDGSPTIIGKRNWWTFNLNIAGAYSSDDTYTPYILSIYELPMQQPISSTSATNIGQHSNGASDWTNVNIRGAVYGKELTLTGTQALDHVASQRDIDLAGYGGALNGVAPVGAETYDTLLKDQGARELYEINNGGAAPLSMGQDSGRSAFISINRGLGFYDLYDAGVYTGILSDTNWDQYSHGASQCAMRVVVTDVVSSTDQTPRTIEFHYLQGGVMQPPLVYSTIDGTWPVERTTQGDAFPFHTMSTDVGRNALSVYLDRIPAFLATIGADPTDQNHSLLVQSDYSQINVTQPSFPSLAEDLAVVLLGGGDLTAYTSGFSLVTASTLYIDSDLNTVAGTLPTGSTAPVPFYPPLSLFAPETRYGTGVNPQAINIAGQVANISTDDTMDQQILDLRSGAAEAVITNNISADLYSITHPDELPPIYTKNWLITIERVQ